MRIRYYAGAAAAAGTPEETVDGLHGAVLPALAALHPGLAGVLERCTFMVDGARLSGDAEVPQGAQVLDVLPPFAGG